MNTKHSPGPWTVTTNGINTPDGHIVFFDRSGPPHIDDARVIEAAPDGLSANIKALEALLWAEAAGLPVDEHIEQVRAAIAKATGL